MKTTLLLSVILLIGFSANSQTPNYFGNTPAWITDHYVGPDLSGDGLHHYRDKRFYVSNDTIVGEYTYQIIKEFVKFHTSAMAGPDDFTTSVQTDIIVRQDGRNIYFLHEGADSLFISYELEIGDHLSGYFGALNPDKTVHTIDSVLVGDNYRRIFYTDTEDDPFPDSRLIEGIGHLGGNSGYFFSSTQYGQYWTLSVNNNLNCYGENNITIWTFDEEGGTCLLTLENEDLAETELNQLEIYPNPTNGITTIQSDQKMKAISIYTIDGNLAYQVTSPSPFNQTIDLSHLEKGIYLVNVQLENGSAYLRKLINN